MARTNVRSVALSGSNSAKRHPWLYGFTRTVCDRVLLAQVSQEKPRRGAGFPLLLQRILPLAHRNFALPRAPLMPGWGTTVQSAIPIRGPRSVLSLILDSLDCKISER